MCEVLTKYWWENLKEGVDAGHQIILKWLLEKQGAKMRIGFSWLRMRVRLVFGNVVMNVGAL
jgi:hypothetical protein